MSTKSRLYGEVNPRLRYLAEPLQKHFPGVQVFHLVRDGRWNVRSLLNYGYYHAEAKHPHRKMKPNPEENKGEWWASVSPFERACWFWNDVMERNKDLPVIRFEDVCDGWKSFKAAIFPFDPGVRSYAYERRMKTKVNQGSFDLCPEPDEWSQEQRRTFLAICGDMMKHYGYETGNWNA